ncbi:MAG: ABC transporter ATP-binding protein/permease [Lachnospiraceae bacterium]|nr:ABC transporter ATP-binding protein/permease [Lachnospiraceae bacterium]
MKKELFMKELEKKLSGLSENVGRLVSSCRFDLSKDGNYMSGIAFLTERYLGTADVVEVEEIIHGNPEAIPPSARKKPGKAPLVTPEPERYENIRLFEIECIKEVRIERLFASSILAARCADTDTGKETDVYIASFSGIYMAEMNSFLKETEAAVKNIESRASQSTKIPGDSSDIQDSLKRDASEKNDSEDRDNGRSGHDHDGENESGVPGLKRKRTIFARVMRYLFRYKVSVITLFVSYILAALVSLVWPYLSGTVLYDGVLAKNDEVLGEFGFAGEYFLALIVLVIAIAGARLLQLGITILQQVLMARVTAKTVRDLKQDIFKSMGDLSLRFFTAKQTGSLMTRVRSDADRVTDFFLDGFPFLFVHSFTIISTFIVMFRLNKGLALVSCVLLPVLVFLSVKLRPALWTLYGKRHRAERSVTTKVNDNLTGARVVKAFGREDEESESFAKKSRTLMTAEVDIVRYNNRFTILYNLVAEISNIWVWIVGVILLIDFDSINLGTLITFIGYVGALNGPLNFFSYIFRTWTDSINSAQRMFEIIDAVPDIKEAENPIRLTNPRGEVELSGVTFGYESFRPVLKDITLHVHAGENLGIVGRSGAGKSTLVNLISRLYDTDEGTIKIDGHDVRDIAFSDLRRSVAMVSQDTYVFMGSVADNIAYADKTASRADIIRAARLAGAHDFITAMPDGYDTIIGAGGKDLSGGERQRISIARAILADPKILILDEATSSVDTKTERIIQDSISYLAKGRTTLSIAHRLSTLKGADRLIVIDNGRIVEEGTHDELYAMDGIYHMLSDLQTGFLSLEEI